MERSKARDFPAQRGRTRPVCAPHNCYMPRPDSARTSAQTAARPLSAPRKALLRMGLERDIDLALHLPLRYEDETRLWRLRDVRDG